MFLAAGEGAMGQAVGVRLAGMISRMKKGLTRVERGGILNLVKFIY